DPANPEMKSGRRRRYELKLDVTAEEAGHSLLLDQLVKSERGLGYKRRSGFIPPCTTMVSHSELSQWGRKLSEEVGDLADRYAELNRAVWEYIQLAEDRPDVETQEDKEIFGFSARMVDLLEFCASHVLDPLQSPLSFFRQIDRTVRSAALC